MLLKPHWTDDSSDVAFLGEKMREQLLLLIRISKPEYNRTLYEEYKLFMVTV